jgi:serine/threonine-protein kinase RsbW
MCPTGLAALAAAEAAGNSFPIHRAARLCASHSHAGRVPRTRSDRTKARPVEFEVPGRAEMLALIRSRVVRYARSMPFSDDEIEDIKLAVGEASANAIRHGSAEASCKVGVRMERRPRSLKICITDQGCGFDPASVKPPPAGSLEEHGRGIALMRALVDRVRFQFSDPGTRVELTKRVGDMYS